MSKDKIKLSDLQPNLNNPRIIRDERFTKLKENIKRYSKFLAKRPIVIDSWKNPIILGGNMRFRALQELNFKEIPKEWVKTSEDLTDEEKKAFIIIDNVEFGESDWDKLANEWDKDELQEWGVELKMYEPENKEKEISDNSIDLANECPSCGYRW